MILDDGGGVQVNNFARVTVAGRPERPIFAPQQAPTRAPAIKLSRARVRQGAGQIVDPGCSTARLTGKTPALSWREIDTIRDCERHE